MDLGREVGQSQICHGTRDFELGAARSFPRGHSGRTHLQRWQDSFRRGCEHLFVLFYHFSAVVAVEQFSDGAFQASAGSSTILLEVT